MSDATVPGRAMRRQVTVRFPGEQVRTTMTPRLADLSEEELLAVVVPLMRQNRRYAGELLGPGDDAAVVATSGAVVATTDTMLRGQDWRDDWSSGADVGHKLVAQNLADLAAMGAVGTGLLVTLAADPQTELAWVRDLAQGIGAACARWAVPVVGGDICGAASGVVVVGATALGDLADGAPVLRSGARAGDLLALAGGLGRSDAGLQLLEAGLSQRHPEAVAWHRRPEPPLDAGVDARRAGATSMIDISDGLLRDAHRVARASGVRLDLDRAALDVHAAYLRPALSDGDAWRAVLAGGEEHSLLASYPSEVALPTGWQVVGAVFEGDGVTVDGEPVAAAGWDHFRP